MVLLKRSSMCLNLCMAASPAVSMRAKRMSIDNHTVSITPLVAKVKRARDLRSSFAVRHLAWRIAWYKETPGILTCADFSWPRI